ncbi:hypothetical protein J6590_094094 [Homalodisca vitripennis]|nr:hypothetical protein J6590_094094 [Homalodisca vitripennis]
MLDHTLNYDFLGLALDRAMNYDVLLHQWEFLGLTSDHTMNYDLLGLALDRAVNCGVALIPGEGL